MLSIHEENNEKLKKFSTGLASQYLITINLLFLYLDFVYFEDLFMEFLRLRIISIGVTLGLKFYLQSKPSQQKLNIQLIASLPFLIFTAVTHYTIYRINDPMTPYWTTLALTMIAMTIGFSFSWKSYLTNSFFLILPFVIFAKNNYVKYDEASYLLYPLFLLTMFFISSTGKHFFGQLSLQEFKNRKNLNDEIQKRNQVIAEKTQEAIKLNSLNKQLSPQVLNAINEEKISFEGKTHRSEICAIFVDIKDSTTKFATLDRDSLQKIISMYMEDVMGIMLRYDITIDKFLGDGVMGFSNDPVIQSDYIERAMNAAVDIVTTIKQKGEEYKRHWGDDFEVRVGLSTGYASIGFYGSDLHVKSYTAIGRVINLASRTNGMAKANGIAVSQDVLHKLKEKNPSFLRNYKIANMDIRKIKGFEHENIKIYEVEQISMSQTVSQHRCPFGHGNLVIAILANKETTQVCRYCDYKMNNENFTILKVS